MGNVYTSYVIEGMPNCKYRYQEQKADKSETVKDFTHDVKAGVGFSQKIAAKKVYSFPN